MDDKMKAMLKPILSVSIMKKKSPDEMSGDNSEPMPEPSFKDEGLKTAAEEIMSALDSKDASAFVEAMCSFLEIYEKEEEEESPEEEKSEEEEAGNESSAEENTPEENK